MRYIGNKTKLIDEINDFIIENNIQGKVFCDIFAGTGAVSDFFKDRFQIISNDFLSYSYILVKAKITNNREPDFKKFIKEFQYNPFEYFNKKEYTLHENYFVANNYSPLANRQFLSIDNSIKIDGIRIDLDNFYKGGLLSENEFTFLLASLLESTTKFSNTSGTYEAFLKDWDPRSLKDFILSPLEMKESDVNSKNLTFKKDANSLIREVSGDILYIDPPYTITEYSSAYHLLETIARYDYPEIAGKTARRQNNRKMSKYTRKNAIDAFEDLIHQASFNHIIISYSNESLIPIDDLTNMLKKYSKNGNVIMKSIRSNAYKNIRESKKSKALQELLIYIQKDNNITQSPLNYSGSKYRIFNEIRKYFPNRISDFVDVMGGAFNVGVNVYADRIYYNEYNPFVFELIIYILNTKPNNIINYVEKEIDRYGLDNGKKQEFYRLREDYNSSPKIEKLYLLTMFCFQNQIRFNNDLKFNTPVGNCGYNPNLKKRILDFKPKTDVINFSNKDFTEYPYDNHDNESLFYFDPPYIVTNATYNDGKRGFEGWTSQHETELLELLTHLDKLGYNFMLSNVIHHRGKTNTLLLEWIETHQFKVFEISNSIRKEVVVINYDLQEGVR
jgi:adenine-specific DNA-methyltransferase